MLTNHKRLKQKKRNRQRWVLVPVFVFAIAISIIIILRSGIFNTRADTDLLFPPCEAAVEKSDGSISIPGFESIILSADRKKQSVALSNPAENNCYFRITLSLKDGTELWTSELIPPGEDSAPIKLNEPLTAGSYPDSVLKYQCFRMDSNLTTLNGAETKLTLTVR